MAKRLAFGLIVFLVATAWASEPMPEHEHAMVQIPDGAKIPKLSIALTRDTKSGFNLAINTQCFELEPPELGGNAGACLEGHAHIYINGNKIYRAYSQYIHLPAELFGEGKQQVMVSLNDHEHNTWSKGSKMVMSTLVIDPQKEQFIVHSFQPFEENK